MGDTGAKRSDLFPRPACAFRINYQRFASPELSEHALNRVVLRSDPAARDGQDIEKGMRKPCDEPVALEVIGSRDWLDLTQSPERKEAQERNRIEMARMIGEQHEGAGTRQPFPALSPTPDEDRHQRPDEQREEEYLQQIARPHSSRDRRSG